MNDTQRMTGQLNPEGLWFQTSGDSEGEGEWIVLLHGFPASSDDWADVAPGLAGQARVLVHDMLGYGRSSKPAGADYSVRAHTDRLLRLCQQLGIRRAAFVGHDLGGILLQQIIHRWRMGHSPVEVTGAAFLNSSIYHHLYRPTLRQRLLAYKPLGRHLVRSLSAKSFKKSMAGVWGPTPPKPAYLEALWQHFSRGNGHLLSPDHLQYIAERKKFGSQWMQSVQQFDRPLALVWGIDDPVSGKHVLDHARVLLPRSQVTEVRAGHFPQVEAPQTVLRALLEWVRTLRSIEA
ncbi:alpha/beta fold hydrolase [Variovorax sp. RCC_210]|uniref:alpha/beta fold hydrolase n=1 Tax=Variovorax sp. RCC_210 TaxID=3239217 RepID=UPI0035233082